MSDIEITEEQTEVQKKLNPKQEMFCQLYATDREFFGNGVESYMEAYDPDRTEKGWYDTARANASRLLTDANILTRINELLDVTLNDAVVDKQLALVVIQNADYRSKVQAIDQYNKLKSRITSKLDITSKGKQVGGITPEAEAIFKNIFKDAPNQDTPTN
jgi:hypothetical protein